jgi:hypothetical protein
MKFLTRTGLAFFERGKCEHGGIFQLSHTLDLLLSRYNSHQKGQKMNKENEKEIERECGRECPDCPINKDKARL